MTYYTIDQNKIDNTKWDVKLNREIIIESLDSAEFADKIAQALNEAFALGIDKSKELIKERLNNILFN